MPNIREILENNGVEESKITEILPKLEEITKTNSTQIANNTHKAINDLDIAIMRESDPVEKSILIAKKISFSIDNGTYY